MTPRRFHWRPSRAGSNRHQHGKHTTSAAPRACKHAQQAAATATKSKQSGNQSKAATQNTATQHTQTNRHKLQTQTTNHKARHNARERNARVCETATWVCISEASRPGHDMHIVTTTVDGINFASPIRHKTCHSRCNVRDALDFRAPPPAPPDLNVDRESLQATCEISVCQTPHLGSLPGLRQH